MSQRPIEAQGEEPTNRNINVTLNSPIPGESHPSAPVTSSNASATELRFLAPPIADRSTPSPSDYCDANVERLRPELSSGYHNRTLALRQDMAMAFNENSTELHEKPREKLGQGTARYMQVLSGHLSDLRHELNEA